MKVTRTFTVTQRGVGKPDYSREISIGRERPGLTLKYSQALKIFTRTFTAILSPYAFVTTPLASGATDHLVDAETGLAMPYSVPAGYIFTVITSAYGFTQDAAIWTYLEGALFATGGVPVSGQSFYVAEVVGISTSFTDPDGLIPHILDVQIVNRGLAAMEGGVSAIAVVEAVGTPALPTTKTVRCKFCGCEETVPHETIRWSCPKCNKLNLYYNLRRFRGTR